MRLFRIPRHIRDYVLAGAIFSLAAAAGCVTIDRRANDVGPSAPPVEPPRRAVAHSTHSPFGLPSGTEADPDDLLIAGEESVFSYNNSRGTVNWVAWRTTRTDLGNSIPRPDFEADQRLPKSLRRIAYYDYSGSGYDRGHMVPSADRFADPRRNSETFLMTNIVPQTSALNQYPWEKFESYVRGQVRRKIGFDAYQIAGVYGEREVIKSRLTAPTNCWKVVVLIPRGRMPVIDERTRVIAVDMPNIEGIEQMPWERYRVSVRSIEEKTGLDLFTSVPRPLQDVIEARVEISSVR
jgi:endonuclease G